MSIRRSRHIDRRQAETFFPAIRFAEKIGRPLNTHVTINFDHTACRPERVSAAFERLRDNHFTRWLRYQSRRRDYGPPVYTWVIENAGGDTHAHWMVHIPPSLAVAFAAKLPQWVETVSGVIHCAESAINREAIWSAPGLGRYLMKGINPHYARVYYVRPESQGVVYGKRCGISKSLGPAARGRYDETAEAA